MTNEITWRVTGVLLLSFPTQLSYFHVLWQTPNLRYTLGDQIIFISININYSDLWIFTFCFFYSKRLVLSPRQNLFHKLEVAVSGCTATLFQKTNNNFDISCTLFLRLDTTKNHLGRYHKGGWVGIRQRLWWKIKMQPNQIGILIQTHQPLNLVLTSTHCDTCSINHTTR